MGSKNRAVLQLNPNDCLRIVVTCHAWYDDLIGGSFRLASEFAEHLADRGHHVSYVCCATSPELPSTEHVRGVDLHRYPAPAEGMSRIARLRYHVLETRRLVAAIHDTSPIHAVSSHSPLQGLGAAQALRRTNSYINYTVHSPFDDELTSNNGSAKSLRQKIIGAVARRVDRRNVQLADVVQTLSRYTQQDFRRKYRRSMSAKGIVAPGWVEADQFQPAEDRRVARGELGGVWDFDGPVFFTLRRLENRMGLETLVEACAVLKSEGLNFRTLIGGGGSLRETLQQQIDHAGLQDSVFLLGRLPEEQLAISYAAADCFVLPTRALECFGLIVLEAFACQTPVIASDVAAIPELARRQGDRWMFEPGDVERLAARMRAFVQGELKPTQDLREIALQFDKPKILQQWTELLLSGTAVSAEAPGTSR